MALSFTDYKLDRIINPNMHCTQILFTAQDNPDVQEKSLILFDNQIKYIEIEEHQKFKRVKVYVRGDEEAINLDFFQADEEKFVSFLQSVYNKQAII